VEVPHIWDGKIEQVKIVEMTKGPKKKQALLFYGKVRALELDPNAFSRNEGNPCCRILQPWEGT